MVLHCKIADQSQSECRSDELSVAIDWLINLYCFGYINLVLIVKSKNSKVHHFDP